MYLNSRRFYVVKWATDFPPFCFLTPSYSLGDRNPGMHVVQYSRTKLSALPRGIRRYVYFAVVRNSQLENIYVGFMSRFLDFTKVIRKFVEILCEFSAAREHPQKKTEMTNDSAF